MVVEPFHLVVEICFKVFIQLCDSTRHHLTSYVRNSHLSFAISLFVVMKRNPIGPKQFCFYFKCFATLVLSLLMIADNE